MANVPFFVKHELAELAQELMAAIEPLKRKYPGLEVTMAFGLRHEEFPQLLATAVVGTPKDPLDMMTMLVKAAREVNQQLVAPPKEGTEPERSS